VGDQPISQRNRGCRLCFCWQRASHAQCVTCAQMKKKKKKNKKEGLQFFEALDREGSFVFETEARANSEGGEEK
jgi:hypothetical protein